MNVEQAQAHGESLVFFYAELLAANQGYKHDPEAHNLCSAVVERGGKTIELLSYSNPSGLAVNVRRYVQGALIPDTNPHYGLIQRGGMQDLQTEVRLINHLWAYGMLSEPGVVTFFSTRSICKTCAEAIAHAQRACAANVGFVPIELKAEDRSQALTTLYAFNAQPGTFGAVRGTGGQGTVEMNL